MLPTEAGAHAFPTGWQREAAHAAHLPNAPSRNRGRDELHRVVDTQAGHHAVALQEEELGYDRGRRMIVDLSHQIWLTYWRAIPGSSRK